MTRKKVHPKFSHQPTLVAQTPDLGVAAIMLNPVEEDYVNASTDKVKRIQKKKIGTVRSTTDAMRSKFVGHGLGMRKTEGHMQLNNQ